MKFKNEVSTLIFERLNFLSENLILAKTYPIENLITNFLNKQVQELLVKVIFTMLIKRASLKIKKECFLLRNLFFSSKRKCFPSGSLKKSHIIININKSSE